MKNRDRINATRPREITSLQRWQEGQDDDLQQPESREDWLADQREFDEQVEQSRDLSREFDNWPLK